MVLPSVAEVFSQIENIQSDWLKIMFDAFKVDEKWTTVLPCTIDGEVFNSAYTPPL